MLGKMYHVGLTVVDMDRSIAFYRDILGLKFSGELIMEGPETDALFQRKACRVRVAYMSNSEEINSPPIELIEFLGDTKPNKRIEIDNPSISEVCFLVKDISALYEHLVANGVECLSEPQFFDFSSQGFGKSKALYFRDPNGIILEAMQNIS